MTQSSSYRFLPLFTLWFGAAISLAEMEAGGLTVNAGFPTALWAIISGHAVGAVLLGLMGLVGFREKMPAIMCTRISFGVKGSWLLSFANAVQLLGWTAVMLRFSGQAAGGIAQSLWGLENIDIVAVLFIAALVALWSLLETQGLRWGNMIAVALLFSLALLMTWVLGEKTGGVIPIPAPEIKPMTFGVAFDLSLVMPLSWCPLVADYACRARSARVAFFAPMTGYFLSSVWIYGIGFTGAVLTGTSDPIPMMIAAGFGVAALSIVALSTLCSAFLDVYSTLITLRNVSPALPEKATIFMVTGLGAAIALFINSELYMHFLTLVGAIFAPIIAILLCDALIFRVDHRGKVVDFIGVVSLGMGVASHAVLTVLETSVGPTLGCLVFTVLVHGGLRWGWSRPFRPIT